MKQKPSREQTMSRIATWVVYALMAWTVWMIGYTIWGLFNAGVMFNTSSEGRGIFFLLTICNLVFYVGVLVIFWLTARLLHTVRQESGPFVVANVKRLKGIGLLLIGLEALELALTAYISFSGVLSWGNSEQAFFSPGIFDMQLLMQKYTANAMGGLLVVMGVAVYCIGLVVARGVALQQQSDETL